MESGVLIDTLNRHTSHVLSVAISPDNKKIVPGSIDKKIRIWDLYVRGLYTKTCM